MTNLVQTGATTGTQTMRALRRHPDRVAFAWDGGQLTYAATLDLIGRMQRAFHAAGLRRGQRVGVLSGNRADSWCAGVAAQALGLSTTALHSLSSLDDQAYQLEDAEVDALVVDPGAYAARGAELAARVGRLSHVFTLGPADFGHDLVAAALDGGSATPQDLARADDIAILNYTGGTTGRSKGAWRRHRSLTGSTSAILADFEIAERGRYLAVAPISHVAGSKVLPTLIRGGTVHLLQGFNPGQVLRTIQEQRITMALLVPTMIYALLDDPALSSSDLSSLELLLYGASPMSPTRLLEGLERIGPVFSQLYGQTECYPLSVLRRQDHDASNPGLFASCGHPVTSCDVRLLDEAGNEVPTGTAGEICARGPYVMDGYWKLPEQTAETLAFDWLHTGDMAVADERGYLFIVDRKKDMIVTGGFNVFPRGVEDVLTSHPAVATAAVIGVPDAKWGEAVMALVTLRPGASVAAEELSALVKDRLGSVQAPKRVEFVDALPTTGVGKVDKKVLRARYWEGQARMVG
ncbi:AMP-binding protein [Zavarzinia sp. CC-PAN008]|uniref:AMP-binding protein n=1 Tax=Zavarzinia sp. CC-PAN008 TaxID=3243332 RepID=UPI003F744C5A